MSATTQTLPTSNIPPPPKPKPRKPIPPPTGPLQLPAPVHYTRTEDGKRVTVKGIFHHCDHPKGERNFIWQGKCYNSMSIFEFDGVIYVKPTTVQHQFKRDQNGQPVSGKGWNAIFATGQTIPTSASSRCYTLHNYRTADGFVNNPNLSLEQRNAFCLQARRHYRSDVFITLLPDPHQQQQQQLQQEQSLLPTPLPVSLFPAVQTQLPVLPTQGPSYQLSAAMNCDTLDQSVLSAQIVSDLKQVVPQPSLTASTALISTTGNGVKRKRGRAGRGGGERGRGGASSTLNNLFVGANDANEALPSTTATYHTNDVKQKRRRPISTESHSSTFNNGLIKFYLSPPEYIDVGIQYHQQDHNCENGIFIMNSTNNSNANTISAANTNNIQSVGFDYVQPQHESPNPNTDDNSNVVNLHF